MTTYHDIDVRTGDGPGSTTVMLVDNWNDIQQRVNIRADQVIGFSADWNVAGYRGAERYQLDLYTTVGTFTMQTPHADHDDDAGVWFADILDELSNLLDRHTPRRTP